MGKVKAIPTKHQPENLIPKTINQQKLFDAIKQYNQIFVLGPPGTGKSFITVGMAADWFASRSYHKLFICRPMVSNGDELGILKGDVKEKCEPWAQPALNIIASRIGIGKMECDLRQDRIVVKPLQMMQGYSLDDTWLVVDEAQEMTISQAKMIVTRMGHNSKLLLNGDINQCNLKEDSGLKFLIDTIENKGLDFPVVHFDIEDCQRSEDCKKWIKALY